MHNTIKIITIISAVLISLTSCTLVDITIWEIWRRYDNILPDRTKLVGMWKAEDGAVIRLNEDGTCDLKNVRKDTINKYTHKEVTMIDVYDNVAAEKDTCGFWNFNGYWCIKPFLSDYPKIDTIGYMVYLSSTPSCDCEEERLLKQRCYTLGLIIHNKKNFFTKEITPSVLYSFVGHPDPFDTYAFYKVE